VVDVEGVVGLTKEDDAACRTRTAHGLSRYGPSQKHDDTSQTRHGCTTESARSMHAIASIWP
jgi:hypothetical protein